MIDFIKTFQSTNFRYFLVAFKIASIKINSVNFILKIQISYSCCSFLSIEFFFCCTSRYWSTHKMEKKSLTVFLYEMNISTNKKKRNRCIEELLFLFMNLQNIFLDDGSESLICECRIPLPKIQYWPCGMRLLFFLSFGVHSYWSQQFLNENKTLNYFSYSFSTHRI